MILEPEVRRRNTEYRLSLLSNHSPNWILQKTEDGIDTYYYNTTTGEMRIDPPNEQEQPKDMIVDHRWSDQSSTLTHSNIDREVSKICFNKNLILRYVLYIALYSTK